MDQFFTWEEKFNQILNEESVEMGSGHNVLYRLRKLEFVRNALSDEGLKVYISNKEGLGLSSAVDKIRKTPGQLKAYMQWVNRLNQGSISFSTSKINAFTMHKLKIAESGIIFTFSSNRAKRYGALEGFNWDKVSGSYYGDELELRLLPHKSIMQKGLDHIIFSPKDIVQIEVFGLSLSEMRQNPDFNAVAEWCIKNQIFLTAYTDMFSCLMGIARFRDKNPSSYVRWFDRGNLYALSDDLTVVSKNGEFQETTNLLDSQIFLDFPILLDTGTEPHTEEIKVLFRTMEKTFSDLTLMNTTLWNIESALNHKEGNLFISERATEYLNKLFPLYFKLPHPNFFSALNNSSIAVGYEEFVEWAKKAQSPISQGLVVILREHEPLPIIERIRAQFAEYQKELETAEVRDREDKALYIGTSELINSVVRFLNWSKMIAQEIDKAYNSLKDILDTMAKVLQSSATNILLAKRTHLAAELFQKPMFADGTIDNIMSIYKHGQDSYLHYADSLLPVVRLATEYALVWW